MKHKGAYSTGVQRGGSDDWMSPRGLFRNLDREFRFTLDAAASAENALCARFWTVEDDALTQDWSQEKSVWCNPPYSQIPAFLVNAQKAETTVFLVPTRMQALWWMRLVLINPHCHEIRHLLRNPRFVATEEIRAQQVQPGNRSPQACCVLVFRNAPRNGEIRQTLICADTALTLHVIARGGIPGRPTVYDAETLEAMLQLYKEKKKPREIAQKTNMSLRSVYRVIERLE
ncbi:DNA N-6-adenine-methyltransferase [Raoultella ornithinolytica]|uniref:DNA N-6-adenine-methyltransferase n=1 Tax=Klebsiella/Raoultella group TaxID=2890311 RepID=UPI0021BA7EF3|nr:DNA N-6-adenine-methyltransferase [Raoultella ornithinolytica]EKU2864603.1 helix-turn-helix domain-containing protein [Raoultella ornithinolytica]MCT8172399.1 helix-turn-helix domain-containing protein [Raoultella ornithinolytica]